VVLVARLGKSGFAAPLLDLCALYEALPQLNGSLAVFWCPIRLFWAAEVYFEFRKVIGAPLKALRLRQTVAFKI